MQTFTDFVHKWGYWVFLLVVCTMISHVACDVTHSPVDAGFDVASDLKALEPDSRECESPAPPPPTHLPCDPLCMPEPPVLKPGQEWTDPVP